MMSKYSVFERAAGAGVAAGYHDINGVYHPAKEGVLEVLVARLENGVSGGVFDDVAAVPAHQSVRVEIPPDFGGFNGFAVSDEQGRQVQASVSDGLDSAVFLSGLDEGYYDLTVNKGRLKHRMLLVAAPQEAYRPVALSDGLRMNGLTVQLYSLRSAHN